MVAIIGETDNKVGAEDINRCVLPFAMNPQTPTLL